MERSTALVYATVAVIVGVTVVSGPSVGLVDLTTPRADTTGLGQGNATIDRVEAPDRVRLDRGFQSESYRLEVPDARVHVAAVSGRPILNYRIEIDGMGYSRTSTFFLDGDDTGWKTLSFEGATLGTDEVTRDSYNGTLSVVVRASDTETVVYRASVPVEVVS